MQNFKEFFSSIWLKFKYSKELSNEVALRSKQLDWTKSKLRVQKDEDFKEWLQTLLYDVFELGRRQRDPQLRAYYDGQADMIERILNDIAKATHEIVDAETKNIGRLKT